MGKDLPFGLIPAHAGKTRAPRGPSSGNPAHPRSRGENPDDTGRVCQGRGSSPLTRGKPTEPRSPPLGGRLIPAHAGKTPARRSRLSPAQAHPRSRGENSLFGPFGLSGGGSSPLTRGKRRQSLKNVGVRRLIPAHAGKTAGPPLHRRTGPAHPRSRGENVLASCEVLARTGSSPLTRGKHFLTCVFTAQIDQILETLELAASFGSYLIWVACATDAPQDPVRSIGLVLPSSMGAS